MTTEVIDQTKLEAICKGCFKSFAFQRSNLNQMVVCKNCGFSSFLTLELILNKTPIFSTKKVIEKEKKLKHLFHFHRHGADSPQLGVISELTTSSVTFSTLILLPLGSKIEFFLKNKKFIVKIKQSVLVNSINQEGSKIIQYEILAEFETVLTGELKTIPYNPHYLIKK